MSKVIVYSTMMCPWCHRAKDFFKEHNIPYENKDVADDDDAREEMVKKSGQMGVPVIDIDGKIIIGFDQQAIKKALKI